MNADYRFPSLAEFTLDEVCKLLIATGASQDPSDLAFAQHCRDEILRRKPLPEIGKENA